MSKFENDFLRNMGSSKFEQDFIEHHGIKGQHWGVRRYQNPDGTLTAAGRARVDKLENKRSNAKSNASNVMDRDIHSFDPYTKTGIKTKKGRVVLTAKDVRDSQSGLRVEKHRRLDAIDAKYDKKVAKVTGDYKKVRDRAMSDAEVSYKKKNGSYRNSSTTKRVKNDYKNMSDKEFQGKYMVSKKTYAKRVSKYGDPYMNSPLAQRGKTLQQRENADIKKIMDKRGVSKREARKIYMNKIRRNAAIGLGAAAAAAGASMYLSNRMTKQTNDFLTTRLAQQQSLQNAMRKNGVNTKTNFKESKEQRDKLNRLLFKNGPFYVDKATRTLVDSTGKPASAKRTIATEHANRMKVSYSDSHGIMHPGDKKKLNNIRVAKYNRDTFYEDGTSLSRRTKNNTHVVEGNDPFSRKRITVRVSKQGKVSRKYGTKNRSYAKSAKFNQSTKTSQAAFNRRMTDPNYAFKL